jgi:hypothetical protein
MTERERLPDRRGAELVDFEHEGRRWTATFGRFANGRIAELFIDGSKEAPIVELAQESAIVASLALQGGCALETLRHALAGRGVGPLALRWPVLDLRWQRHGGPDRGADGTSDAVSPLNRGRKRFGAVLIYD